MKSSLLLLLLLTSVFLSGIGMAQAPASLPVPITMAILCYELPKQSPVVAQAKNSQGDVKASLKELEPLVAGGSAKVIATPAIAVRSGQRAIASSGDISLEVDPVLGPTGDIMSVSYSFKCIGQPPLAGKSTIRINSMVLLGAQDKTGDAGTSELIFLLVGHQSAESRK